LPSSLFYIDTLSVGGITDSKNLTLSSDSAYEKKIIKKFNNKKEENKVK
jgi:hypothetical protein